MAKYVQLTTNKNAPRLPGPTTRSGKGMLQAGVQVRGAKSAVTAVDLAGKKTQGDFAELIRGAAKNLQTTLQRVALARYHKGTGRVARGIRVEPVIRQTENGLFTGTIRISLPRYREVRFMTNLASGGAYPYPIAPYIITARGGHFNRQYHRNWRSVVRKPLAGLETSLSYNPVDLHLQRPESYRQDLVNTFSYKERYRRGGKQSGQKKVNRYTTLEEYGGRPILMKTFYRDVRRTVSDDLRSRGRPEHGTPPWLANQMPRLKVPVGKYMTYIKNRRIPFYVQGSIAEQLRTGSRRREYLAGKHEDLEATLEGEPGGGYFYPLFVIHPGFDADWLSSSVSTFAEALQTDLFKIALVNHQSIGGTAGDEIGFTQTAGSAQPGVAAVYWGRDLHAHVQATTETIADEAIRRIQEQAARNAAAVDPASGVIARRGKFSS